MESSTGSNRKEPRCGYADDREVCLKPAAGSSSRLGGRSVDMAHMMGFMAPAGDLGRSELIACGFPMAAIVENELKILEDSRACCLAHTTTA